LAFYLYGDKGINARQAGRLSPIIPATRLWRGAIPLSPKLHPEFWEIFRSASIFLKIKIEQFGRFAFGLLRKTSMFTGVSERI